MIPMRESQKQELLQLLDVIASDERDIYWCALQYIIWLRHLKTFSNEALGDAITVATFAMNGEKDAAKEYMVRSIEGAIFGKSEYRVTKENEDKKE